MGEQRAIIADNGGLHGLLAAKEVLDEIGHCELASGRDGREVEDRSRPSTLRFEGSRRGTDLILDGTLARMRRGSSQDRGNIWRRGEHPANADIDQTRYIMYHVRLKAHSNVTCRVVEVANRL
jgi:hypothetical protein